VLTSPICGLILLLKNVAGSWSNLWHDMEHVVGFVVGAVIDYLHAMAEPMIKVVEGLLSVASHLPFVGGAAKSALNEVKGFDKGMGDAADSARNWGETTAHHADNVKQKHKEAGQSAKDMAGDVQGGTDAAGGAEKDFSTET